MTETHHDQSGCTNGLQMLLGLQCDSPPCDRLGQSFASTFTV